MSHAKLSPSSAFRWLSCPGSIRMSEGIEDTGSPAAAEGTLAHELGELALRDMCDTVDVAGEYSDEMRDYIQEYVEFVREFDGKLKVEQRVDLGEWIPGSFGTSDVILKQGTTLHVMDLKYGMNRVIAKDNSQMMLYALGSLKKKTKTVVMHICQPRIGNWDKWEISAKDLRAWGEEIKPLAALCLTDDAPLNPSNSACQYCLAAPTCPALHAHAMEIVGGDFATLPAVEDLTPEQLATVVLNKKLLVSFINKIEEYTVTRLESGTPMPGLKLVESVTRRKYNDKAIKVIPKLLGDAAYKPQDLIAMSAAEKLIGKAKFAELDVTVKPKGKHTVAPDGDRRPAITKTVDDFDKS